MKKKKCLVTGGAGFIGSHVVDELIDRGWDVTVIDDLSVGEEKNVNPKATFFNGDINNGDFVRILLEGVDVVFHFAYEATECKSIFSPVKNTETNVMGSMVLVKEMINKGIRKIVFPSCHDKKTRLVTKDGLKYFYEINKDDIVFTLNKETGYLEESKIKDIIISQYKGEMIKIKSRRIDSLVTPNHRILYNKSKTKEMSFIEANKILTRKTLQIPISKGVKTINKINNKIKLKNRSSLDPEYINYNDLMFLIGAYIGDGCATKCISYKENKSGLNRKKYLNSCRDNKGRFKKMIRIGKKELTKCTNYQINFCLPTTDKDRKIILNILKRNGFKVGENRWLQVSSKSLYNIFKECGDRAYNKHIPKKYLNNNKEALEHLYNGLMSTDGSKRGDSYTTVSKTLCENFIELGYKIGKDISFKQYEPKTTIMKNGHIIKGNYNVYRINIATVNIYMTNKNFTKEKYDDIVWCLRTKNENFMVERNGKTYFSGNSVLVYGKPHYLPINEIHPVHPDDPYSVSKMAVEHYLRIYHELGVIDPYIVRFNNTYGPRLRLDNPYKGVTQIFINRCMQGKNPCVFGDGSQQRAFTYVEDLKKPIVDIIEHDDLINIPVNLGTNTVSTVLDVANMVKHLFNQKEEVDFLPKRSKDIDAAYCNVNRMETLLKHKCDTSLKNGLKKTIEWALTEGVKEFKYNWTVEIPNLEDTRYKNKEL